MSLTHKEVKELFDYKDGHLYWKKNIKNGTRNFFEGDKAGKQHSAGYIQICLNNKLYLAHRLIFLWHHGHLPRVLDHIDGDKTNNRIENLREATYSENLFNTKPYKTNTSGYKNVTKNGNKWMVQFSVNRKIYYCGLYDDVHEAGKVAKQMREKLHGEFARHE